MLLTKKLILTGGIIPTKPLTGRLEFCNVGFRYPCRENVTVFKDLILTVPPGSVMAVVGSSGSGKSTLASLLLRYYEADLGKKPYYCKGNLPFVWNRCSGILYHDRRNM